MSARVVLEKPTLRRRAHFMEAVRRSRSMHQGWVSPPNSIEALRSYVRRSRTPSFEPFWIVDARDRGLVGVVNLSEIVRGSFHSAYMGYYAFVPHAGTGAMFKGMSLVIQQAFRNLRLHRLEANIRPENERSLKLVQRLGFQLEGYSPRYLKIGGRWRDHQRWALLAEEWKPIRR